MKNNDRSQNFDYFTQKHNKQVQKKSVWKRIWFWLKTFFYVSIFGITMTGCVQSMVVKSSTYTGGGVEFYLNKDEIAPSVATFKPATYVKSDKFLKDGTFYSLVQNREYNFLLSKNISGGAETLSGIQAQTKENGGTYGEYGGYSTGIQLLDKSDKFVGGQYIVQNNGKYLFKASSATSYSSIYDSYKDIMFLEDGFTLGNFFTEQPATSGSTAKTYTYRGLTDNKKYIYQYDQTNNKFLEDEAHKVELGQARLAKVANTFSDSAEYANVRFNRDVLEFLYRNTFTQDSYYATQFNDPAFVTAENNSDVGERYNQVWKTIVDGTFPKKTITEEEYNALQKSWETIKSYLAATNFSKVDPSAFVRVKTTTGEDAVDKNGNALNTKYWKADYEIGQLSAQYAKDTKLAYLNTDAQKPISSWSEAWALGPFFGFFAYPMGALTGLIRNPLAAAGGWTSILAIFVAVIITRVIALLFTWKATVSQTWQEDIKQKKAKIDAKYAEFKNNKQMKQRHQQEVQQLYKKHGINPVDILLSTFISLPIFIAMWRVIQSVPTLKSTTWLGISFAATSWREWIYNGHWQYFGLLFFAVVTQVLSQILPRILNRKKFKQRMTIDEKKALRKSNRMQNYFLVFFVILTVIFGAGVQVYWIFTSLWGIAQTVGIHYFKKSEYFRRKYLSKVQI
ncbi:membrane protein insertase YidC [Mycoplasmopsis columbinasalis]|uniref:Putative inner membrane protein translocase component YidC n=1 Tax=Mycoplasmopsis columbinasalis TaxID=114880 RepID=A0A449BAU1_9BACT|nr:membrane protein insertase YidC [Mycoplasmopsis columbinasalis]VEU78147.1 putative inner membrane protein translocase component YidC [Mycoplasmopsis columbinasalis]